MKFEKYMDTIYSGPGIRPKVHHTCVLIAIFSGEKGRVPGCWRRAAVVGGSTLPSLKPNMNAC
jgi:hypothetical protein